MKIELFQVVDIFRDRKFGLIPVGVGSGSVDLK